MKILVITQYFWPENFRINDLCLELKSRGHSVVVLTGEPNYPEGAYFPEYISDKRKFDHLNGIEIFRVPIVTRGNNKFQLLINYFSFLVSSLLLGPYKVRNRDFDIVLVCQLSPPLVALSAIFLSKIRGIPLVMWVLDLWPHTLNATGHVTNSFMLRILQQFLNLIYKQCSALFVQSQSFAASIRSNMVDRSHL